LCLGGAVTIVRAISERSAARLAHQSGGLGVPSSNLGAPTKNHRIELRHAVPPLRGGSGSEEAAKWGGLKTAFGAVHAQLLGLLA
jgi:hypothetical protein